MSMNLDLDKESLIDLICKHCEFYKESDEELEYGALKILKGLLEQGVITPEDLMSNFVLRGGQMEMIRRIKKERALQ